MNFKETLVSVIIPAYNHEKYIQETIKSIISQTYKNIELIIVNDGSKDSTWEKIQEMKIKCEERFTRIHFETKENEGSCRSLNKLLSLAQGEFVYIIASDDLAKPEAIEKELKFLKKNPNYALVVGDNEIIDDNGNVCYWDEQRNNVYNIHEAKYKTFGDFLQKAKKLNFSTKAFGTYPTLYTGNYIPNGYLIRKSIFEKTGYFTPEAPLEDYWLMLQISKYAKMKYLNNILFSYRWHKTNTIKNTDRMQMFTEKTLEYEEKILSKINKGDVLPRVCDFIKNRHLYKKVGIPCIFEILSYKKQNEKIRKIKIFNIDIIKFHVNK